MGLDGIIVTGIVKEVSRATEKDVLLENLLGRNLISSNGVKGAGVVALGENIVMMMGDAVEFAVLSVGLVELEETAELGWTRLEVMRDEG